MKYLNSLFFFFIISGLSAQAPSIQWQKALGGNGGELANAVQQTSDGGYIIAGESTSSNGDATFNHGNSDVWIVKLDASGTIQWQKSLGGSFYDTANSVQQTADGGYILTGESASLDGDVTGNHGNADYWVVKLDASGNIQWQKSLGGSAYETANSVQQTTDGGYIVVGECFSTDGDVIGNHGIADYWVVKLDASGVIQWQKSLGGSSYERGNSVQQTTDGGYIVAGGAGSNDGDITAAHGNEDFWIVKLDASGNIQWDRSLTGNIADAAESIQQTSDGGYIVAGGSNSVNSEFPVTFGIANYCVAKLDASGNPLWQRYFGGSGNDYAYSTQQTADGGYIVAGGAASLDGNVIGNHGNTDCWIIKLDDSGNLQWQKALGGTSFENAYAIQQTNDGGYIIAGQASSTDGDVTGIHDDGDAWVIKLNSEQLSTAENQLLNKPSLYPNPAKDFVNIDHLPAETTVSITDMSGRLLFTGKYNDQKITVDVRSFITGTYFIQVLHKDKVIVSEKLLIRK
ncbi:MAG: T9SS type A sorting domain-containing protein [Chryseobacterium sp.]|jgi:hypothetical protein|uniref:T9SS type A sorting domain-containing protein n=1 Tax=Chryseobacterium sp. TaxID=1871047 RepID=UPI00282B02AD|nr:T9SS type A sorting domain-containing protein [Chryseobacterium sp.]MDR2236805.1 T9SS type A sorting domain-containing protein [Chryseobacterium sp.]